MVSAEPRPSQHEILANRFELVSRLADDVAHEIKNPLHAMVINLEVLRRKIAAGAPDLALERARVIEHEIHRVHQIVDHMLRLLRPDPGDGPADVDVILAELTPLLELQTRLAHIEFSYHPCGDGAVVRASRDALRFALLNLAETALDGLRGAPGSLTIRSHCADNEVQLHITAVPAAAATAETDGGIPGIVLAPDREEATLALTAELVRDAGGSVGRGERGGPETEPMFFLALPRITTA